MRLILLFAILIAISCCTNCALGQEIKLNVITFNPCDSTFENDLLVHVFKDGKIFRPTDVRGTIYLPQEGTYQLGVFDTIFYRFTDSVKSVHVTYGQNYDTLIRSVILECFYVNCKLPPEYRYCGFECCDNPCEGFNVDYFDNGQRKIDGFFKGGIPIGELTFYYPNGRKKEIHHFDGQGQGRLIKKERFDR